MLDPKPQLLFSLKLELHPSSILFPDFFPEVPHREGPMLQRTLSPLFPVSSILNPKSCVVGIIYILHPKSFFPKILSPKSFSLNPYTRLAKP